MLESQLEIRWHFVSSAGFHNDNNLAVLTLGLGIVFPILWKPQDKAGNYFRV